MNCPQCGSTLCEPRDHERYCEDCGFPDENRATFNLVEIKAYLRSKFLGQNCADDIRPENYSLAIAYNLLLDERFGISAFCDNGKADNIKLDDFQPVKMK